MAAKQTTVRTAIIAGMAFLSVVLWPDNGRGEQNIAVKVMTYNIRHGEGTDDKLELKRIAQVIRETGAELIGLNEVDNNFGRRSDFADQAKSLAGELGMNYVYGPALVRGDAGKPAQYGEAILSKYPILAWKNHKLFTVPELEPRVCLEAKIQVGKEVYSFLVTHLDHTGKGEARVRQAEDIVKIARSIPGKKILIGDFNCSSPLEQPDPKMEKMTRPVALILEQFNDAFALAGSGLAETIGSKAPQDRIDYIFVSPDLGPMVKSCKVVYTPLAQVASDHLPVIAEIGVSPVPPNERKPFDFKQHSLIIASFKGPGKVIVEMEKGQESAETNIVIRVKAIESAEGTIAWDSAAGYKITPATFDYKLTNGQESVFTFHCTIAPLKNTDEFPCYKVAYGANNARKIFFGGFYLAVRSKPKTAMCPRILTPPRIDGKLDDACWQSAAILKDFVLNNGDPAREQTIGYLACDKDNVYIAMKCLESQVAGIVANAKEHDGPVWDDDTVEIFLDPNNDQQGYFQILVNSRGAYAEQKCSASGRDWKWNPRIEVGGSVHSEFWVAEIAIPFKELGLTESGKIWGVNLNRDRPKRNEGQPESSSWNYTGGRFHAPDRFGKVQFERSENKGSSNIGSAQPEEIGR